VLLGRAQAAGGDRLDRELVRGGGRDEPGECDALQIDLDRTAARLDHGGLRIEPGKVADDVPELHPVPGNVI
jgi:hypothetical protein